MIARSAQIVILVLAISGLVAFDTFVALRDGYWSVFPPFAHWSQTQMFVDLATALGLAWLWIAYDVKKRAQPAWITGVVLVLIVFTGSLGPLLYLLLRAIQSQEATSGA